MTLKKYITGLQEVAKKHPDLLVIAAKDTEGNGYSSVYYSPTIGHFNPEVGEFHLEENIKESPGDYEDQDITINAVCIN